VATGLVDGAGLVGDLVLRHPLEGAEGISTKAAVIGAARDEDLRRDVDVGPGCVSSDFDTIG